MFIRFKRGGTEANEGVVLGNGELGVDLESKALHFHDGESPGGYRATPTQPLQALADVEYSVTGIPPFLRALENVEYVVTGL